MSDKAILPQWYSAHQRSQLLPLRYISIIVIIGVYVVIRFISFSSNAVSIHEPSQKATASTGISLEHISRRLKQVQDCSIKNVLLNTSFLSTAHALGASEYTTRRDRLAQALVVEGLDAFIIEPGYTFKYYANVSQPDWEVWEPEERPFLMVVQPQHGYSDTGLSTSSLRPIIQANTTFLVPSFEAERARLLNMPFEGSIQLVTYEEHWNPYDTLLSSSVFTSAEQDRASHKPRIMVDDEMRDFISRGLAGNGFDVRGLSGEVERVRQRKSAAEIGILRAVNTGTVECVRAMRKCLKPGMTEDDVQAVLDNTMRAVGLDPFFDIVLFDENAANPHGGTDGAKILEPETMVLIDVGAHLLGYSSDICRSFFPPFLRRPETSSQYEAMSDNLKEKMQVWDIVFEAQTASLQALRENQSCASVDLAARGVIEAAGYGKGFTHRVGHGIGIKAHEAPYLHKGNVDTLMKAGMVFTSEPGVYLADRFGVRHEDVLLVRETDMPELLTGRRADGPWDP